MDRILRALEGETGRARALCSGVALFSRLGNTGRGEVGVCSASGLGLATDTCLACGAKVCPSQVQSIDVLRCSAMTINSVLHAGLGVERMDPKQGDLSPIRRWRRTVRAA
jgi:hypothetical protein